MSDANDVSEVRREAARARWGNQVVTRAAEVVVERADELDDGSAEDVMMAVARGPFAELLPERSKRMIAQEDRAERRLARAAERERGSALRRQPTGRCRSSGRRLRTAASC